MTEGTEGTGVYARQVWDGKRWVPKGAPPPPKEPNYVLIVVLAVVAGFALVVVALVVIGVGLASLTPTSDTEPSSEAPPAVSSEQAPSASPRTSAQPTAVPSIEQIDEHSARLNAAEFGDAWPLTVPTGIVRCDHGAWVMFETDDGTTYPVNGTAKGNNAALPEIDEIWADDPDIEGL